MKYLIVDDEPIAHQIMLRMCADLPFLELAGQCYTAMEALAVLNQGTVDLMFLDIQMPKLGGFDFLRTLRQPPLVIAVSAHAEYALEGFDLNVVDYLLKPFSFERFVSAVNKARASLPEQAAVERLDLGASLFLKDGKRHYQIRFTDILLVEASGNYCLVHHTKGRIMTQEKISDLEKLLPPDFLRVHKSYIVAWPRIDMIESNEIHLGNQRIPIGRSYKARVSKLLG